MSNGRMMNGAINDSKINITSNPLAGLDTSEDTMQPKVGIAKWLRCRYVVRMVVAEDQV